MNMTSVHDRCTAIATFRYVSVWLMETIARWTPTTPEMEAKVMFGRHIWDYAQMADALGKRTFELRQPMHHTVPPAAAYMGLLNEVAALSSTVDRVSAIHGCMLPCLTKRLKHYVALSDAILDEPSIVIIEHMTGTIARQNREAEALKIELKLGDGEDLSGLTAREQSITSLVAERAAA